MRTILKPMPLLAMGNGELLFYLNYNDSLRINSLYDKNGKILDNGDSILIEGTYARGMIILPFSLSPACITFFM
jgi:hypothetical protein